MYVVVLGSLGILSVGWLETDGSSGAFVVSGASFEDSSLSSSNCRANCEEENTCLLKGKMPDL